MCSLCFTCYILNSMYRQALHAGAVKGEIVHRVQSGMTKADQYVTRTNEHRSTMVSRPSLVKIEHQARIIPAQVKKTEGIMFARCGLCGTYSLQNVVRQNSIFVSRKTITNIIFSEKKMTSQYRMRQSYATSSLA